MTWMLVTGAKGFIGSAVVRQLTSTGVCVAGLGHGAMPPPELEARQICEWINGDVNITNLQLLEQRLGKPSAIIHLAGGSSVGQSLHYPKEDFGRTVESTIEVLEWTRQSCPETPIVYASSAAVYGNSHSNPINESAHLLPYSPYGSHKAIAEILCKSYAENYGLSICIVRLFSIFGPFLQKQLVYELCVRLSKSPAMIELGGTGREQRDFLFVDDAAKLLCKAIDWANPMNPIVNGGRGVPTTVAEVARQCCIAWQSNARVAFNGKSRPGDPFSLVADTNQLDGLGFKATVGFEEGVNRTVAAFARRFA